MTHPDSTLIACLSHLAGNKRYAEYHCTIGVLEQLQRLGLIQAVPGTGLPLNYPHASYRLTRMGKDYLKPVTKKDK